MYPKSSLIDLLLLLLLLLLGATKFEFGPVILPAPDHCPPLPILGSGEGPLLPLPPPPPPPP